MATVTRANKVSRVSVSVNPQKQTIEHVNRLVKLALGRAGCDGCGRIAYIDLGFLGDPGPDFSKFGAISVDVQEG